MFYKNLSLFIFDEHVLKKHDFEFTILLWSVKYQKRKRSIKMHVFDGIKMKGVDKTGEEKEFSLSELGERIVLYFYPKDNTLRCTQEAREFRDKIMNQNANATVVGISPDSIESHKDFLQKNSLNFPLLSDPENSLARRLGVDKEKMEEGNRYMTVERSTFIVKNGLITKAWKGVEVDGHVDEVIRSL